MAQPSHGALQTWLQLSDDLLSRAWGSMDRYHLAWLMVGKPKGIVRGRPMTAEEEAAYVREVATQKTAALRMSLDAVERQRMPFVGRDRGGLGVGGGDGRTSMAVETPAATGPTRLPTAHPTVPPTVAACLRPDLGRSPGGGSAPRRCASRPRGAASTPPGPDGAVTAAANPRPGGRRHAHGPGPGPDRRAIPAAGPAAGPADPRHRGRLLRAGRAQGTRRYGAAPGTRSAARGRPGPDRTGRARGGRPGPTRLADRPAPALEGHAAGPGRRPPAVRGIVARAWGSPRRVTTTGSSATLSRSSMRCLPGVGTGQ